MVDAANKTLDPISSKVKRHVSDMSPERHILAVYDFADLPYSFDISAFLLNAEVERRRHNCKTITIVFVAHASDPGSSRSPFITEDNFRHFIHNYGLENTRMLPSIGSVLLFTDRKQFMGFFESQQENYVLFPKEYNPLKPHAPCSTQDNPGIIDWSYFATPAQEDPSLLCFTPPAEYLKLAQKWITSKVYPKIPVVITLREWGWRLSRNNDMEAWQELIDYYQKERPELMFIIIRDYYTLYTALPLEGANLIYCDEAVISLPMRAAMYESASFNLTVSNGPSILMLANQKCRYIVFKIASTKSGLSPEVYWRDTRLRPGDNFHGAGQLQHYIWEDDTFSIMHRHVNNLLKNLHISDKLEPAFYQEKIEDHSSRQYQELYDKRFSSMAQYNPEYLKSKVKQLLTEWISSKKRVVIYGAGQHTENLLDWTGITQAHIVGIVDSNPNIQNSDFGGFMVKSPNQISDFKPDVILISSNSSQDEISQSLEQNAHTGIEIACLYSRPKDGS